MTSKIIQFQNGLKGLKKKSQHKKQKWQRESKESKTSHTHKVIFKRLAHFYKWDKFHSSTILTIKIRITK